MDVDARAKFLLVGRSREDDWRLVLVQAVSPLGVLQVETAERAMETIQQGDFDVVIVDACAVADVPGLISGIRASRPGARVVAATERSDWRWSRAVFRAGAADCILKTQDSDALCRTLMEVLDVDVLPRV